MFRLSTYLRGSSFIHGNRSIYLRTFHRKANVLASRLRLPDLVVD